MKYLIVASWKMNPTTLQGAKLLFNSVKKGIKNACPERSRRVEVVVCPPFPYLVEFFDRCRRIQQLKLGAQDCFWEEKGAYTGEVSPKMLKDLGVEYVIIGHSERRRYLKETDEMVSKKLRAVLDADLKPILCVGSKDKNQEKEFKEIKIQLERALLGIKKPNPQNLIITYEPVWAISTTKGSKIATPCEAKDGANFIRKILIKLFDKNFVQRIRIIYGGSVDSKNILGFIKEAQMDGALVGAASLRAEEFIAAVKVVDEFKDSSPPALAEA